MFSETVSLTKLAKAFSNSKDLLNWESQPAAASLPGVYQLEVPQYWQAHGREYLFFSTLADSILPGLRIPRMSGTFYLVRRKQY